ncbi:hypothetical protein AgCh_038613 [Apium graveolens]
MVAPNPTHHPNIINTKVVVDIPDNEGAPSKRQKTVADEHFLVHRYLGATSSGYFTEEEQQVSDFKVRTSASIKDKRVALGLEEAE